MLKCHQKVHLLVLIDLAVVKAEKCQKVAVGGEDDAALSALQLWDILVCPIGDTIVEYSRRSRLCDATDEFPLHLGLVIDIVVMHKSNGLIEGIG